MTTFDQLAPTYGQAWTNSADGHHQRTKVWREIGGLFRGGDRVLDLGCGIGDDALHLAGRGVSVHGIDSSIEMVEIAQSRGVSAQHLAIEDLGSLEGPYDGALSNFGALNCVEDLRAVARNLARLIRPGSALAACVMGRVCWSETARFLLKLDWRKATRRWPGHARWRGMDVYYRTSASFVSAFEPEFHLRRRVSIGGGDHQLFIFTRRPDAA